MSGKSGRGISVELPLREGVAEDAQLAPPATPVSVSADRSARGGLKHRRSDGGVDSESTRSSPRGMGSTAANATGDGDEDRLLEPTPVNMQANEESSKKESKFKVFIQLLRNNAAFRNLWIAALISSMGSWFNEVATVVLIQGLARSALPVSVVYLVRMICLTAMSPIAGVLIDRYSKIMLLIAADVARAMIVLLYPLANSPDRMWLVFVAAGLQACFQALFQPCRSAIIPLIVDRNRELDAANTLISMINSTTMGLGSMVGGMVTAATGTTIAYFIDSASYLTSLIFVVLVARNLTVNPYLEAPITPKTPLSAVADPAAAPKPAKPKKVKPGFFASMGQGFKYMWRERPELLILAFLSGMVKLSDAAADMVMIAFANTLYRLGHKDSSLGLGIAFLAFALGILAGPLIQQRFLKKEDRARRRWLAVSSVVLSASYALVAVSVNYVLFFIANVLTGAALGIIYVQTSTMLQSAEPAYLGRVLSTAQMMKFTLGAVGYVTSSLFQDYTKLSLREIEWIDSVLPALIATCGFMWYLSRAPPPGGQAVPTSAEAAEEAEEAGAADVEKDQTRTGEQAAADRGEAAS